MTTSGTRTTRDGGGSYLRLELFGLQRSFGDLVVFGLPSGWTARVSAETVFRGNLSVEFEVERRQECGKRRISP